MPHSHHQSGKLVAPGNAMATVLIRELLAPSREDEVLEDGRSGKLWVKQYTAGEDRQYQHDQPPGGNLCLLQKVREATLPLL